MPCPFNVISYMFSVWEHCFFLPLVPASHPSEQFLPSHQNHQPSEQQSSTHTHTHTPKNTITVTQKEADTNLTSR